MSLQTQDAWGVEHCGTPNDIDAWNAVVHAVVTHHESTAEKLDTLLDENPDFASALALKGLALMFKGRRDLLPIVDDLLATTSRLDLSTYDRALFGILQSWRFDDYPTTERRLAELVENEPKNLLAVKLQHGFLFIAGKQRAMLDALNRVLPEWSDAVPGYGYVLGCLSFGLGELWDLDEAERVGIEAAEREPDDAWGIHAVCHVHEMRDDNLAGIRWLREHQDGFAQCNNFRGHVFWHQALFELALGHIDEVFALCDGEVRRAWCGDYRDMSNVASLLWRLEVDGYEVGQRWQELGALAAHHHTDHGSAFADAHYALALSMSGRHEQTAELLETMAAGDNGQAAVVDGPGRTLCRAIAALGEGRFQASCAEFTAVQADLSKIGGSNAQRDLFEQLHIEAALASGNTHTARRLLQLRLKKRPRNPWAQDRFSAVRAYG